MINECLAVFAVRASSALGAAVRATALAALLLAQACHGPAIGRERASAYFNEHRAALEQVVEQARLCRPETGRIGRNDAFRCTSSRDAQKLKSAMQAANAQWIRVSYGDESEQPSLTEVHVVLRSQGMAFTAGVLEEFIFETTPTLHAEYERKDDGIAVIERQPVTEPPHHWYWRKIDR